MKLKISAILFASIFLTISCKNKENKVPSGYNYTVDAEGSGASPKVNDYVFFTVKIMGDSSKVLQEMGEGPQMPILQIPGEMPKYPQSNPVLEMLAVSKIGGVYKFIMPVDSIPNPPADIKDIDNIVYEIAVKKYMNEVDFKKYSEEKQAEMQAKIAANMEKLPAVEELTKTTLADYKAGKLETQKTASGVKYYIVKKGEGPNATAGSNISVNYYGVLMDGTMFDNSYRAGQAYPFTLGAGQVIKGWDDGLLNLNKGAKAFLFIPPAMAYGSAGSPPVIPADAELAFYVEMDDISGK
ncbi:MAG: FKBP-type peptidyl-prolyl cis-trans isomerase [Saprospiraceae bacterium]|nr:FKBP-type peptidyl-prolyl cis-trans isomerase [Saprospiraceae bacterium]